MDRKTLIIIIAGIVVIFCLVFGLNSKDNEVFNVEEEELQTNRNVSYNKVTDETTGETHYQIYDKDTGEIMHNVMDESSLQIYIDNPDFIGPENEEMYNSEITEYNEDESIIETVE